MQAGLLMAPLGWVFGAAAATRRSAYRRGWLGQQRLLGPVISVGNLSVGGSGKTPVVALVASILTGAGHPVAVLSRGYRGAFRGQALLVSDGERQLSSARIAGDEPAMLARELRGVVVAVGRRRDVVGRMVEERLGPRVHVLDDGFQHLRLERDLDLVCLGRSDLLDRPLPAGRLREFSSAARRADALLVSGGEEERAAVQECLRHGLVFQLLRSVAGFFGIGADLRDRPRRPFGFCGIARPERFFADLAAQAPSLAGRLSFRDHHAYSAGDVQDVVRQAVAAGADALVTTAKDAVRLPEGGLDLPLLVLKMGVSVEPADAFRRLVLGVVERHRDGRPR